MSTTRSSGVTSAMSAFTGTAMGIPSVRASRLPNALAPSLEMRTHGDDLFSQRILMLAVLHRSLRGLAAVKIPEDEWVCDRCAASASSERCALCPVRYGVMKRTTDWKWAHLSCALWIPEVFFRGADGREPIDYLQIPAHRWGNKCCHCGETHGAVMTCANAGCNKCVSLLRRLPAGPSALSPLSAISLAHAHARPPLPAQDLPHHLRHGTPDLPRVQGFQGRRGCHRRALQRPLEEMAGPQEGTVR